MANSRKFGAALEYRADIDGLRAVAVLSVLLYHMGISRTQGGYVGVDVFFVISGYLISSIVFNEIAGNRYSVIGFYERRIRRIFPALFGMLAVFSIFAAVYFLPGELINYGKSMLAASASASNFYFWRHSGYFDAATSQPLLHTWSLAVEEQFYITFPIFLVLVRKFAPSRLRDSVVILFLVSLLLSAVVVYRSQGTAFYMPYTRAWELLLGTILALKMLPPLPAVWQRNLATISGFCMIGYSVLTYSQETVFPGLSALVPCLGSGLIIWAGESGSSLVGSVLSWRPFVFVGLISYSLYLWHWPVIVLQQMGVLVGFSALESQHFSAFLTARRFDMLIELVLSFVLAILSWRFVERPFRSGPLRLSGRPLFALAGAVTAVLLAFASSTVLSGGFRSRFPANALQVTSNRDGEDENRFMRTGTCFITTDYHFENYDHARCLTQQEGKKNYLLMGDSHSAMLWSALAASLPDANVMQASTNGCEPLLHPVGSFDCKKMMNYVFQSYLPAHPVERVFLAARWLERDLPQLSATIAWANERHIPVAVIGPMPEYDGPLPRLLTYSIAWNSPNLPSQHRVASSERLDAQMQSMATNSWNVPYVSLYHEICESGRCAEYADETNKIALMSDANHLSQSGALVVIQGLVHKGELR